MDLGLGRKRSHGPPYCAPSDLGTRCCPAQVEEFACRFMSEGQTTILEVKIDGGGAGAQSPPPSTIRHLTISYPKLSSARLT